MVHTWYWEERLTAQKLEGSYQSWSCISFNQLLRSHWALYLSGTVTMKYYLISDIPLLNCTYHFFFLTSVKRNRLRKLTLSAIQITLICIKTISFFIVNSCSFCFENPGIVSLDLLTRLFSDWGLYWPFHRTLMVCENKMKCTCLPPKQLVGLRLADRQYKLQFSGHQARHPVPPVIVQ